MKEPIVLETTQNHATITDNGICPTLTASMGTGGGYVPMIVFRKSRRATSKDDYETWLRTEVANTLNTFDGGGVREQQR